MATRAASSASYPAARAHRALLPSSCGEKRDHIAAQLDAFPSLNFLGKDERSRMTLSVRSDDDPVLELIDSEGIKRLLMGRGDLKPAGAEVAKKDPIFSLVLRGPDGKVVWKVP